MDSLQTAVNNWPRESVPSALSQDQIEWAAKDLASKVQVAVQNIFNTQCGFDAIISVVHSLNAQIKEPTPLSIRDVLYKNCILHDRGEQKRFTESLNLMGEAAPVPTALLIQNTTNDDREVLLRVITKIQSQTFSVLGSTIIQFNPEEAKIATLLYGVRGVKQSLQASELHAKNITLLENQLHVLVEEIKQLKMEYKARPTPTLSEQQNFEIALAKLEQTETKRNKEYLNLKFS